MAFSLRKKPFTFQPLERALSEAAQFVPLRQRYILTRENKLRLRYTAPVIAAVVAVCSSIFYPVTAEALSTLAAGKASYMAALDPSAGEHNDLAQQATLRPYSGQKIDAVYETSSPSIAEEEQQRTDYIQKAVYKPAPEPKQEMVEIGRGDTLAALLNRKGLSNQEIYKLTSALSQHYDPRHMRPGQKLALHFTPDETGKNYSFSGMDVAVDLLKTVSLVKQGGEYEASVTQRPTVTREYARSTAIQTSLYGSALKVGIPAGIVAEAIRIYSWDVDFQRDIRRGDQVEVLFEQSETEDGALLQSGDILYARLNVNGRDIPVYRFEDGAGDVDYYTPEGVSIRRALLSTPVDGARISSGYGKRRHPVLGYDKLHKGIDFAAPRGTPIYAAGDGTIERAGRYGSFGNYIRIRHNGQLKTAYAHLNGFARGISAGARVKQGEIIGYIGTTGRSTGPHLHYEVHMNGRQVNPRSVKVPQGKALKGAQLAAFKKEMHKIRNKYQNLSEKIEMVSVAQ